MTGYFILMAYRVTFWMSLQQKTVALSLTRTKYMALSDYSHLLIWMRSLLNKVG